MKVGSMSRILRGDKQEVVMNVKPNLKLDGQVVVLVLTIQMSALL